jgi:hypothetical protein
MFMPTVVASAGRPSFVHTGRRRPPLALTNPVFGRLCSSPPQQVRVMVSDFFGLGMYRLITDFVLFAVEEEQRPGSNAALVCAVVFRASIIVYFSAVMHKYGRIFDTNDDAKVR